MKLIGMWKLLREIRRLFRQLIRFPRNVVWYFLATPYNDYRLARDRKVLQGDMEISDRVAVMVIYPSDGLLDSHLMTLRHIKESGYTTVIVSNQPLSEEEQHRVLPHCAKYIERPNFGYDFGAYRDGVLSVKRQLKSLKRLVLLNDSAWYPLPEARNWISEAENMGPDMVGAVSNFGTPRLPPAEFLDLVWDYKTSHKNFHYCSFALSFGPNILKAPSFLTYWKHFRLDNDKSRVVRRGEIGLSQLIIRSGFTHDCLCNPGTLEDVLQNLSDDRLYETACNIVIPEFRLAQKIKEKTIKMDRADPNWRKAMINLNLAAASLQGTSYALPDLTTKEMGFPFLKKSPLWLSKPGSDTSLQLIADLPNPAKEIILKEARDLVARRAKNTKSYIESEKNERKKRSWTVQGNT